MMRKLKIAMVGSLLLAGCASDDSLQRVLERGELIVATRNGPTTYFIDKGESAGFEHELVSRFADELGVEVSYRLRHNIGDIFDDIRRDQVDFAAAGLTVTESRQGEFRFSSPYYDIDPQIIYLAGTPKPRTVEDLYGGRVVTMSNSSHAEAMALLRRDYPDLEWQEIDDVEPLDLMDMVTTGSATYAIIDSNEFVPTAASTPSCGWDSTWVNSKPWPGCSPSVRRTTPCGRPSPPRG